MVGSRGRNVALWTLGALRILVTLSCAREPGGIPCLCTHAVVRDNDGKLLSWSKQDSPYAHVTDLAWKRLVAIPAQENGLPTYFTHSRFHPETYEGDGWPHNPAGLNAMLIESALRYHAFSGDRSAIEFAQRLADHQLAHGTTPHDWEWPNVPFSSAEADSTEYGGVDDSECEGCGRGDGLGVIEPDKVAELGFSYLQLFKTTRESRYRDAAEACADALARHVRVGSPNDSPWPFRVNARTNVPKENYTAHVIASIQLFDELGKLGIGDRQNYERARGIAWDWLFEVPMKNGHWSGYFEDIPIATSPAENPNQYAPLMTARYLLEHPEHDPDWKTHVENLLAFTSNHFATDANNERGHQFGAEVISEQKRDMAKMGSHTARFASVLALYSERTSDALAKERAFRSFNWATYACDFNGVVAVGPDVNEGYWFSDGYGDYIRHFLVGMGALPEWAPAGEDHLLASSSVVQEITYDACSITYRTHDPSGSDVLRLRHEPLDITSVDSGGEVSGVHFTKAAAPRGGFVVRVQRSASNVVIRLGGGECTLP